MINIKNKVDCCGCNACGDACPKQAISFKTDNEGFSYPEVDMQKCIDCGLCEKVCPIINIEELKINGSPKSECYAIQTNNLESLFNSTSGSAFATFAESIYKEGGYVGGAIYDDNYNVKQFISSDKADLEKLRNSKLVQSDSQGFYKAVKDIVKSGNKCLVCGLPCQMTALRSFLRKDYENLYIIDLVCRGINTPKLLKGYMEVLENRYQSHIVYFKVKNKEYGWNELTTKVVFENGEVLYDTHEKNLFTIAYLRTGAFCRPSCYECRFKGYPRCSDITIADLWSKPGVIPEEMDNNLGTSLVMVNSNKGKKLFNTILGKVKSKAMNFVQATECNPALISSLPKPRVDRDALYADINTLPFEEAVKRHLPLSMQLTKRQKIKNVLKFVHGLKLACGLNIPKFIENIYYNFLCKKIDTNVIDGRFFIVNKYCALSIDKSASIYVGGKVYFGTKRNKKSKIESRLLLDPKSKLIFEGDANCLYGMHIEVFNNACLTIGGGFASNMNDTIICGDSITIGERVSVGRDVTIRDNNGGHFLSRRTYKDKRPVHIGQHCWLCEGAMIMPGTKLGTGVIVGAKSVVTGGRYKNFTMLSGYPAEVVDEDVYVKM